MTENNDLSEQSLRNVLRAAAAEVARLSKLVTPVEAVLERTLMADAITETDRTLLQNLDLLLQSIDAIAGYMHQLSNQVPTDVCVDVRPALNGVLIESTRLRLKTGDTSSGPQDGVTAPRGLSTVTEVGRIEFF